MSETQPQDAWSAFFASPTHYGDRWHQTLYPALMKQQNKAIFYNRYTPIEDFNRITGGTDSPSSKIERVHFPSAANDIQADNLSAGALQQGVPRQRLRSSGGQALRRYPRATQ